MKTFFTLLLIVMLCWACSRGKYYVSNIFRKGNIENMQAMPVDSTYHFYLREVYKDKNRQNENVLKTNVEKNDTTNKTRIEVEYLLLSWAHKSAIYIPTIPDKHQHYYLANPFADTLINAYDFSTFHFGKIAADGESISFALNDGRKIITWDIRPFIPGTFPKKVSIREIVVQRNNLIENVILVDKALEEPVSFTRQNNFVIIFETPGMRGDTCKDVSSLCRLSGQKIYFNPAKHGFDLIFHFDKNVDNSRDSSIRFDFRRTRYSPIQNQHQSTN